MIRSTEHYTMKSSPKGRLIGYVGILLMNADVAGDNNDRRVEIYEAALDGDLQGIAVK